MLSKKYMCGILLLLCFLTLTCVSAVDDQTSTDNPVVTGTSYSSAGDTTGMSTGFNAESLKNFSNNSAQTENTQSSGNGNTNSMGNFNFSSLNFTGLDMSSFNMSSLNFSGMNFSGMNSSGMNFSGMNFSGMNFTGMNSSGMNFSGMNFSDMNLSNMNFSDLFNQSTTNSTDENSTDIAPVDVPQSEDKKPVEKTVKVTKVSKEKSQPVKVTKITQTAAKSFTIKRANDTTVLYQGDNVVTLEELGKIFDTTFEDGRLVLYIDGEVVFNDTVSDDLASTIFEIIDKFLGEHDIKVEFTDNDNNTSSFEENVIIE